MHGERVRHERQLRVESALFLRIPAALKSARRTRSHPIMCYAGQAQIILGLRVVAGSPGLAEVPHCAHKAAEMRTGGACPGPSDGDAAGSWSPLLFAEAIGKSVQRRKQYAPRAILS
jgi:hypothetical protein